MVARCWRQSRLLVALVDVRAGGDNRIETLGPPEIVGWSGLMPPYHWHFDVRAVTAVRAVAYAYAYPSSAHRARALPGYIPLVQHPPTPRQPRRPATTQPRLTRPEALQRALNTEDLH